MFIAISNYQFVDHLRQVPFVLAPANAEVQATLARSSGGEVKQRRMVCRR